MRAESNHNRTIHASKRVGKSGALSIILVAGLVCLIIGTASIITLNSVSKQSRVKGTATQLSASQVLALVNLLRQESGIAPLVVHPALEQAAAQKAAHMIDSGYWDHTDPNSGITPWQFIDAAGYRYVRAGENLARDFDDSQKVTEAWMASPPHRANVLETAYTHTGIGIAYGMRDQKPTVLVVQLMATPLVQHDMPENATSFAATAAVAPQSVPAIVLLLSGGILFVSIGLGLLMRSRHGRLRHTQDHPTNATPPLHLWSS